jgi:hypothetical protein
MPVIKLSAFAGEKPLINTRLLPETAATSAFNTRLDDGALTPTRASKWTRAMAGGPNHKTIYRHQGTWLSWASEVSAAPGPVANDRLYYTGDGPPKMRVDNQVFDLAIARPGTALSATVAGTGNGDTQSRTYCYTLVTSYGEETAPAPASAVIDWKPGQSITLKGFETGVVNRAITHQRIYRSQTGASGTYFYLIAERDVSNADFTDTVAVDDFKEMLPSADWNAPKATLNGLVAMPNGMMAAFSGKSVYFCEPYRPHAWPDKYAMTVDSDIVGLGSIGSVLVVMTKGQPYLMQGTSPDSVSSQKLEAKWPCINARAIVDLGFAICYPTYEGLVAVRADGSIVLTTSELFNRDGWLAFSPASAIAGQSRGVYVLFYDCVDPTGQRQRGALMINVNAAQYLVRSAEYADAVFVSDQDAALYLKRNDDTQIMRFDDPDSEPMTFYWRSKEFWLTQPINMSALLLDLGDGNDVWTQAAIENARQQIEQKNAVIFAGDLGSAMNGGPINALALGKDAMLAYPENGKVSCNIYADGRVVASTDKTGRIVRMPGGFKARQWQVDISSNVQISQVILASTIDELRGQ